jgi:hypothetical protein
MRALTCLSFLLVCLVCLAANGSSAQPGARNMQPTIYDDGKSCPHDCDAHVVFHSSHNGTANAFDPASSAASPQKCEAGKQCTICFSSDPASCMTALYRGCGPALGRFDFTPAFFEENCSKSELPTAFRRKCESAAPAINKIKDLVNCVATPADRRCKEVISAAQQRQRADDVLYNQCTELGEPAFDSKYHEQPSLQRSNDCAYEKIGTGRNSKGETWTKLLPGACRAGTYVGRDGTDCCNGSLYEAALLGSECRQFFVPK